jgi:hypothetical protein
MLVSTTHKEQQAYENIHAVVEGNTGNIFIGDTHLMMDKRTFERLLFHMETAVMEYDQIELNRNAEY